MSASAVPLSFGSGLLQYGRGCLFLVTFNPGAGDPYKRGADNYKVGDVNKMIEEGMEMLKDVFVAKPSEVFEEDQLGEFIAQMVEGFGMRWHSPSDWDASLDFPFRMFPAGFTVKRKVEPERIVIENCVLTGWSRGNPYATLDIDLRCPDPYSDAATLIGKNVRITVEEIGGE